MNINPFILVGSFFFHFSIIYEKIPIKLGGDSQWWLTRVGRCKRGTESGAKLVDGPRRFRVAHSRQSPPKKVEEKGKKNQQKPAWTAQVPCFWLPNFLHRFDVRKKVKSHWNSLNAHLSDDVCIGCIYKLKLNKWNVLENARGKHRQLFTKYNIKNQCISLILVCILLMIHSQNILYFVKRYQVNWRQERAALNCSSKSLHCIFTRWKSTIKWWPWIRPDWVRKLI